MSKQEIKVEAHKLEKIAAEGDTNRLADELHQLSPAFRAAVAREMRSDRAHHQDPSLPKMEFTAAGDIKSVDKILAGTHAHLEYNPETGKPLSADVKREGTTGAFTAHLEYDGTDGRLVLLDEHCSDGRVHHVEFPKPSPEH
jgi:hypothetical protein